MPKHESRVTVIGAAAKTCRVSVGEHLQCGVAQSWKKQNKLLFGDSFCLVIFPKLSHDSLHLTTYLRC